MTIPEQKSLQQQQAPSNPESSSSDNNHAAPPKQSHVPPDVRVPPEKRTKAHAHPYLQGNFYPVFEETTGQEGIECEVVGVIPESLRGSQYIRTGPNTLHIPEEQFAHHFFDGDGNSQVDPNGNVSIQPRYMNRYVRSEAFKKGNKHGPILMSIGLFMNGGRSLWRVVRESASHLFKASLYRFSNVANGNTALAFLGSRLLALQEAGVPWEMTVPALETVGEYYFEQEGQKRRPKLIPIPNSEACTAHPKVDPKNGDTVYFSWRLFKPYAFYGVISLDGKKRVWEQPIPGFKRATMSHDFAITETHSIIMDLNYALNPVKNSKLGKPLVSFDADAPARFAIIPRYFDSKKNKVLWFETQSCHVFHTANAWDEKDRDGNVVAICMVACRSERFVADINLWTPSGPDNYGGGKTKEEFERSYVRPGDGDYAHQDPDATYLTLFRFDLQTMETRLGRLTKGKGISEWEIGSDALQQLDETIHKRCYFGPQIFGSEALFVPRESGNVELDEDDGFLLVYVYDENQIRDDLVVDPENQVTELWIYDAKTIDMDKGLLAKIRIPRRIPYGFHGLLVTKEQIQENKDLVARRSSPTAI
ncbi:hypothetical protein BGW38_003851 [Lunasporangiospora selenospora]|uniref:Dioxygenase n=1 Tax=Lunasporangiospora selenospora TaxID=979761 RepID=A0A9P6FQX0_9FUNG|nr:hypothetical protein BGW38_003851 [Lunasporangiospora selenospora]